MPSPRSSVEGIKIMLLPLEPDLWRTQPMKPSRLVGTAAVTLFLLGMLGCATTAPVDSGDKGTSNQQTGGQGASPDTAKASGCNAALPEDQRPFSSKLVTVPIPDRAVYGDGSKLEFTTSLGADLSPMYEIWKFIDNVPVAYTGGAWEDAGGGRYTTALNVFDEDLDGQEGLIKVTAIPDGVTFDGERYNGDVVVLGIYCITFAVK